VIIRILPKRDFLSPVVATMLMLAGCAATQIINQWSNPDYTAASFKRILVIGVSKQPSIRRTFEDEFVAQHRALGVDAVPTYEFIREDGQALESRLRATVKQVGADAVIMTRLVRVEKKADVAPGHLRPFQPSASIGGTHRNGLAFMNRRV